MLYPQDFINNIIVGDCQGIMTFIPDKSIDMILCDLPYEVLNKRTSWDSMIPMESLWNQYRRIIKDNGAIVLTGQGLFSAKLIMAAEDLYKYTLIWKKNKPRGFLNAKKQPLRAHEDILVFYNKQPTYNPQMTRGHEPVHAFTRHKESLCYGKAGMTSGGGSTERYPISVIDIPVVNNEDPEKIHQTQKPVELGSWLIKTFTNNDDIVLDNACGSGSFCLAAKVNNRKFIGIEKDPVMAQKARNRVVGLEDCFHGE